MVVQRWKRFASTYDTTTKAKGGENLEALVLLNCEEFKFNIVQSVRCLEACKSSWPLSIQDDDDMVDLDTKKFLSLIKNMASKSDKVIINIEEFFTLSSPKHVGKDQEDGPKGDTPLGWHENGKTLNQTK